VALTPFLYVLHHAIDRYLGKNEAKRLIEKAAQESAATPTTTAAPGASHT
jgi:hypothetical protein